jgi:hypothetical protein
MTAVSSGTVIVIATPESSTTTAFILCVRAFPTLELGFSESRVGVALSVTSCSF